MDTDSISTRLDPLAVSVPRQWWIVRSGGEGRERREELKLRLREADALQLPAPGARATVSMLTGVGGMIALDDVGGADDVGGVVRVGSVGCVVRGRRRLCGHCIIPRVLLWYLQLLAPQSFHSKHSCVFA